jgi:hypothetical protein
MNILIYLGIGISAVSVFTFFGYWIYLWMYIGQSFLGSLWYSFIVWSIMWVLGLFLMGIGFLWD